MVKHKGGRLGRMEWNEGSTSGNPVDTVEDIIGIIVHSINTITSSVNVMDSVFNLRRDMGVAFDEKGAPNPNNINIYG